MNTAITFSVVQYLIIKNILKILKKVLFLRILIGFREISNTV